MHPSLPPVSHETVAVNGAKLHVCVAGDNAPLLLLLHGFPEYWGAWRRSIGPLVAAGWRVAMPDQRGYGASSKPRGAAAYLLEVLADDVLDLADHFGAQRFSLVGHDWGGMVAWHVAARNSSTVDRLCILNAPHPVNVMGYALTHPLQMVKSAYVGFFHLPLLPEAVLSANNFAVLAASLTQSSRNGTFGASDLAEYREAWAMPGALRAMLDWYRAMPMGKPSPQKITAPVQILWGDKDAALQSALAEAALPYCENAGVVHLPGASHWLHHEEPAEVNSLLVEFLAKSNLLRGHRGRFAT